MKGSITLGIIVGNRGFFPAHLCDTGRKQILGTLQTFGDYGVVKIHDFQGLLRYICMHGYEHHVAVNPASIALGVRGALASYMGWEVYHHE